MVARARAVSVIVIAGLLVGGCAGTRLTDAPAALLRPTSSPSPDLNRATPPAALPTRTPVPTSTLAPSPVPATATLTPKMPDTATPLPPTLSPTPVPTATPIAGSRFDGVRVTFVYNCGFLITAGDVRVLIDTPYEGYPDGVLKPVLESQPPFDGVDAILVTHEHQDHFSPNLVLQYLEDNPETLFLSTQSAVEQLVALDPRIGNRTLSIELARGGSQRIELERLTVEALYISHGMPGLLNLGFLLELGDAVVFHTGDMVPESVSVADLVAYGLSERQIDVAFVPDFYLTEERYQAHVLEGIQPRMVVPMHYGHSPPAVPEGVFPNGFVFPAPYESWVVPPG